MVKTTEPGTASKDPAYVKMDANPIAVEYYPPKKQQAQGYGKMQGGGGGYQQQASQQGGGSEQYAAQGGGAHGGDTYSESKSSIKFSSLGDKPEMYADMSGEMHNSSPTANGVNNALLAVASKHLALPKYQDKK